MTNKNPTLAPHRSVGTKIAGAASKYGEIQVLDGTSSSKGCRICSAKHGQHKLLPFDQWVVKQ